MVSLKSVRGEMTISEENTISDDEVVECFSHLAGDRLFILVRHFLDVSSTLQKRDEDLLESRLSLHLN